MTLLVDTRPIQCNKSTNCNGSRGGDIGWRIYLSYLLKYFFQRTSIAEISLNIYIGWKGNLVITTAKLAVYSLNNQWILSSRCAQTNKYLLKGQFSIRTSMSQFKSFCDVINLHLVSWLWVEKYQIYLQKTVWKFSKIRYPITNFSAP